MPRQHTLFYITMPPCVKPLNMYTVHYSGQALVEVCILLSAHKIEFEEDILMVIIHSMF